MSNQNIALQNAFEHGITFNEYLNTMTQLKNHMTEHYQAITISDTAKNDFAKSLAIRGDVQILIITEDYCSDAVLNIPIVSRLAEAIPTLALRIVRRGDYESLAENYPAKDGYNHIPTVIFMDKNGSVLAVWHERSAAAHHFLDNYQKKHPRPEKELEDGSLNPDYIAWSNARFAAQKQAYQKELYLDTIYEFVALLNKPSCT